MNRISCYGAFGFVLGEFCRQFPTEVIRIPKHEVVPESPIILYGISTTDNYNVFDKPTLDIETNLMHLMDVLDACHKKYGNKFEFNFISSWFVYGKGKTGTDGILEEDECNPTGFYSITKRTAEQLLISYCETFDIKYRIYRLANVLGWRDSKISKKKNALQYLIDLLVHDEDIGLYEGGNFYRDYIDVRDCVRAIKMGMEMGGYPIFNISNGESFLFKDLIDIAVEISGSKSNVWDTYEAPKFHQIVQSPSVFLSNEKLKRLGYAPQFSIRDTIKTIIEEYKKIG